ncbi:MAG: YebC/PmpR family DNA-binding transcriptional regulator, partial [Clostridia bacterium]|nr:YebC/PmpR family DNA-binding transcriptional regulator [Clostridia bacterium]
SEIRHIFDKCGGSLGSNGCVSYKFERKGVIEIDNEKGLDEDELMMLAMDAGADDVEAGEGSAIFYTDPNELTQVRDSLEAAGCTFLSVERAMIPDNTVEITDMELAGKIQKLLDWLDDYDDTQNVYHDAQLPEMDDEEE